jgi:hypothetical protein
MRPRSPSPAGLAGILGLLAVVAAPAPARAIGQASLGAVRWTTVHAAGPEMRRSRPVGRSVPVTAAPVQPTPDDAALRRLFAGTPPSPAMIGVRRDSKSEGRQVASRGTFHRPHGAPPCASRLLGISVGAPRTARNAVFYDAHAPPSRSSHPAPFPS